MRLLDLRSKELRSWRTRTSSNLVEKPLTLTYLTYLTYQLSKLGSRLEHRRGEVEPRHCPGLETAATAATAATTTKCRGSHGKTAGSRARLMASKASA